MHLDIKPSTIMLAGPPVSAGARVELDKPMFMDFGLALRDEVEGIASASQDGTVRIGDATPLEEKIGSTGS